MNGVDANEAAELLTCSVNMVYKLVSRGELAGHRVGGKIVIDLASIDTYKEAKRFGMFKPKPRASRYKCQVLKLKS